MGVHVDYLTNYWVISFLRLEHICDYFVFPSPIIVMPASATIFNKKCRPILELGSGPYNTVRWNPKGKCILFKVSVVYLYSSVLSIV